MTPPKITKKSRKSKLANVVVSSSNLAGVVLLAFVDVSFDVSLWLSTRDSFSVSLGGPSEEDGDTVVDSSAEGDAATDVVDVRDVMDVDNVEDTVVEVKVDIVVVGVVDESDDDVDEDEVDDELDEVDEDEVKVDEDDIDEVVDELEEDEVDEVIDVDDDVVVTVHLPNTTSLLSAIT